MEQWVAERFGTATGDGALVRGGPAAEHGSVGVMHALFEPQQDMTAWDDFHTYNIAGAKTLVGSPMANRYCRLFKTLESLSGLGQVQHLHRAATAFLEQKQLRLAAMCGHRA